MTAQSSEGVAAWESVSPALIRSQVKVALADTAIGAAKTGLLPGAKAVEAVSEGLQLHPLVPVVVDPVIGSTSGTRFLDKKGLEALKKLLLPLATVATPNWPEAEALTGLNVKSLAQAEKAACALRDQFGCSVLVKGGHGSGTQSIDILASKSGLRQFKGPRIDTENTHGTGCVLSAAIACGLAQKLTLETAVAHARAFLSKALSENKDAAWGGRGPAFPG